MSQKDAPIELKFFEGLLDMAQASMLKGAHENGDGSFSLQLSVTVNQKGDLSLSYNGYPVDGFARVGKLQDIAGFRALGRRLHEILFNRYDPALSRK